MIYILSGWQRAFAPSVKRIAAHNCGTMASDEKNQMSTITNDWLKKYKVCDLSLKKKNMMNLPLQSDTPFEH